MMKTRTVPSGIELSNPPDVDTPTASAIAKTRASWDEPCVDTLFALIAIPYEGATPNVGPKFRPLSSGCIKNGATTSRGIGPTADQSAEINVSTISIPNENESEAAPENNTSTCALGFPSNAFRNISLLSLRGPACCLNCSSCNSASFCRACASAILSSVATLYASSSRLEASLSARVSNTTDPVVQTPATAASAATARDASISCSQEWRSKPNTVRLPFLDKLFFWVCGLFAAGIIADPLITAIRDIDRRGATSAYVLASSTEVHSNAVIVA